MKVLVAYASRHGATAGIAERIAAALTAAACQPKRGPSRRSITSPASSGI